MNAQPPKALLSLAPGYLPDIVSQVFFNTASHLSYFPSLCCLENFHPSIDPTRTLLADTADFLSSFVSLMIYIYTYIYFVCARVYFV